MAYSYEVEMQEVSDYNAELLELQSDFMEEVEEPEDEDTNVGSIIAQIDALELERYQAEKRGDFRQADKLDDKILDLLAQLKY